MRSTWYDHTRDQSDLLIAAEDRQPTILEPNPESRSSESNYTAGCSTVISEEGTSVSLDEEDEPNEDVSGLCDTRKRKRVGKKRNFCPFCSKMISNFSRHLVTCHSEREEIKQYISLSKESPRRRRLMRAAITKGIRNLGNHLYNQRLVENEEQGEFVPVKRSSHDKHAIDNTTHVTCKHCLGFFNKKSLYKHVSRCDQRPIDVTSDVPLAGQRVLPDHSELVVRFSTQASELLKSEVFPRMQKDAETVIVQSDDLICEFGSKYRFTHRGTKQINQCSSKMRTLARLFLAVKSLKPDIRELRDCIDPTKFDLLVEAVRQMTGFNASDGRTKTPSVANRLCSTLKKCAFIMESNTLKDETLTKDRRLEILDRIRRFQHLMEKDWSTEVSTNCENSRKLMKVVKEDVLPDPDDIRKFSKYIHELCPSVISALKEIPTDINTYEKLAKLIIAHIITFNRRRPNETVQITLEAYRSTLNKRVDYGLETQSVLTREEIESGRELSIFYIAANKNLKKVPVLLTNVFNDAIETLVACRDKLGIQSEYLFARPGKRPNSIEELFDGSAVLRQLVNSVQLKNPSTFTANALRHHAATTSQLRPRNDTFTKRLSKFLGHDLRTHEQHYEIPLPIVQTAIVGHRLLEMIRPKTTSTVTSQDLQEAGPSGITRARNRESDNEDSLTSEEQGSTVSNPHIDDDSWGISSASTVQTDNEVGGQQYESNEKDTLHGDSDNSHSEVDISPMKKKHKKVRWSLDEQKALYEAFGRYFHISANPPRQKVKTLWESQPLLQNRTLQQVVTYVNNIVKKKHHITTPMRWKIKRMIDKNEEKLSP